MAIATTVGQEHERSSHSPGTAHDGTAQTPSSRGLIAPAGSADANANALRAVASALDSIYSRVSGAGYTLFMTDASGVMAGWQRFTTPRRGETSPQDSSVWWSGRTRWARSVVGSGREPKLTTSGTRPSASPARSATGSVPAGSA